MLFFKNCYRFHTLEKSRDQFPVNLVLVENARTEEAFVVGHSRLSLVVGQQNKSCLVESGEGSSDIHNSNAMVTNHLRALYGVYFTKYCTILRRLASGRKNCTIF